MRLIMFSENQADQLLSDAVAQGRVASVKILLNAMIDPNTPRCVEALRTARASGYDEAAELLSSAQAREPKSETDRRERAFSPHP